MNALLPFVVIGAPLLIGLIIGGVCRSSKTHDAYWAGYSTGFAEARAEFSNPRFMREGPARPDDLAGRSFHSPRGAA
jgi:hypothetical protein